MTTIATGNRRLLRLAKILDTADALHKKRGEPMYDQDMLVHKCGTPACAWGHWWASTKGNTDVPWYYTRGKEAFAVDEYEVENLFGGRGCGGAKTAKQAAAYIRKFVKARS